MFQLERRSNDRIDLALFGAIFVGYLTVLLMTTGIGFPRDESFYFHAAYQYVGWFEELWANLTGGNLAASFTQSNIDKHWSYNPEHPVLMKGSFAVSLKVFHDLLGWMSPSTAMRFPAMLLGALTVALTYLMARPIAGRFAALVAAGAIALQPRFFFHAHLACFDVPITAMWLAVVYAYWRSFESKRWVVATGVLFGLALSTKLNAFFLPIVLGGHWLLVTYPRLVAWWRQRRTSDSAAADDASLADESADGETTKPQRFPFPWVFVSMGLIGPFLFLALWPRHWFDTFARIEWYMRFHLEHVHYFVYYFGDNLQQPPHPVGFPWAMTAVTVPATILLASALGIWAIARSERVRTRVADWREALSERRLPTPSEDRAGTLLLLAINLLFPIALIAQPATPIFGGTKHWMPAMPFLAIFAGIGVAWALRQASTAWQQRWLKPALAAGLTAAVLGPAFYGTVENHPYGTSYYNELIGSYRGAADARMMRQFWGYTSRQALPWLNEHAVPRARVDIHNTTTYAWGMYGREELRRDDLRAAGQFGSQYLLHHHQKAFVFRLIDSWEHYGTRTPAHVVAIDGVPLLSVYEKPSARRPPVRKSPPAP